MNYSNWPWFKPLLPNMQCSVRTKALDQLYFSRVILRLYFCTQKPNGPGENMSQTWNEHFLLDLLEHKHSWFIHIVAYWKYYLFVFNPKWDMRWLRTKEYQG